MTVMVREIGKERPGEAVGGNDPLLREVVRLNAITTGLVTGILGGLVIFLATMWLVVKGGYNVGQHLSLLSNFFPGYRVTFLGSFIGFGYGFVSGFVAGLVVGRIYNFVVRISDR